MIEACRSRWSRTRCESEYDELFVGAGKAPVTPYLAYYLRRHSDRQPAASSCARSWPRWGSRGAKACPSPKTTSAACAKRCAS